MAGITSSPANGHAGNAWCGVVVSTGTRPIHRGRTCASRTLALPGLLAGYRGIPSEEGAAEMVPVYGQQTAAAAELDSIQPELPAI